MALDRSLNFEDTLARLAFRSLIISFDFTLASPACFDAWASSCLILASMSLPSFLAWATASFFLSTV